jgi:hypothetical protein
MQAYVLIKVRTGEVRDVVRQLRRVEGISEANMIGQILATNVQPIPGILETMTCLAVEI